MIPRALHDWVAGGLRRRFLVTLGLVMAALSLLFLALVVETWRSRQLGAQERAAGQFNGLLQASLENAMLKRDLHGLQDILADIGRAPGIVRVQVLNPALEVRFASHPDLIGARLALDAFLPELLANPGATRVAPIDPVKDTLRALTAVPNQPICHECHGSPEASPVNGILAVDYSAASLGQEARRGLVLLLVLGGVMIAATSLTVWWALSRSVIAPVSGLARAMAGLKDDGTGPRLAMRGQDEIARLGQGFDRMADRLAQSMAALKTSQAQLQAVIDAIPDGIRVIGPGYRIVMANAAYARQAGLPMPEILGQPCHTLSHARATPCPETLICCPVVQLGPDLPSLTCRQIHHLSGSAGTHVEVAAARVETSEGPWVIEAIRDLHQQAQLGQEHRLAELAFLAAGLAHEIHNPLSTITLLVDALAADPPKTGDRRMHGNLALLRGEIARTLDLTNALLTLCQPPGPVQLLELADVLPSTLKILGFAAREKHATLTLDIPDGLRLIIAESDLRLAVTNLVQNAIHAIGSAGLVHVRARRDGAMIILDVIDNGSGIAPEDLPRVTLPFWTRRADGTQGRGLGLTLVQAAMERAGGRLEIDSTPKLGSRFTLVLPDPDTTQEPAP